MRIQRLVRRLGAGPRGSERGMVSAEYAVGIIAAVAFALLLLSVMQSDAVRAALVGIVSNALSVRG